MVGKTKDFRKWFGFLLVLLLVLGSTTTPFRQFAGFPRELRLFQGEGRELHLQMPVSATASVSDSGVLQVNGSAAAQVPVDLHRPVQLRTGLAGRAFLTLKLFGTVPIKRVQVRVLPPVRVIPGGQSIGVKLQSLGVLVVGHHVVHAGQQEVCPAEQADIRVGDYLIRLGDVPIRSVRDVASRVEHAGKSGKLLEITLVRSGKTKKVRIRPAFDKVERMWRLGLYIRDSAAGVGTLTFYDPDNRYYGALGHVITDMDTNEPIRLGQGKIVHSSVTSIEKGESGEPGEKRAIFFQEDQILGNILKNTPFGIFGHLERKPAGGLMDRPIPVALSDQVKEGPAQILTVVEGQKVEAFNIRIAHVLRQKFPATKGLIIKVTDPRLLAKTGGIVQGMSGSPIIQDGKLVGAVTHVFVNDPTSGYGTHIEWMLRDAGAFGQAADSPWESAVF